MLYHPFQGWVMAKAGRVEVRVEGFWFCGLGPRNEKHCFHRHFGPKNENTICLDVVKGPERNTWFPQTVFGPCSNMTFFHEREGGGGGQIFEALTPFSSARQASGSRLLALPRLLKRRRKDPQHQENWSLVSGCNTSKSFDLRCNSRSSAKKTLICEARCSSRPFKLDSGTSALLLDNSHDLQGG